MTDRRLIQAALAGRHADELLRRVKGPRSRPWLDDLPPLGRIDEERTSIVYSFIDVSTVIGHLLPPDDPVKALLFFIAMSESDQFLPWEQRRLSIVPASEFYP